MSKTKKITGITIKLAQATEVTVSLAEARELYNELKDIFGTPGLTFPDTPIFPYGGIPRNPHWMDSVWCKANANTVDPSNSIVDPGGQEWHLTPLPKRKKVFIRSD